MNAEGAGGVYIRGCNQNNHNPLTTLPDYIIYLNYIYIYIQMLLPLKGH